MLRASACHNYSAESDDSAWVSAEAFIQGLIEGGSWPDRNGFPGEEGESWRNHGVCAFLCDCRGEVARHPRTGEAAAERALDAGGGCHGTAQPPPLRGTARAALLTRITLV